ncbi:fructosamine kinase family protein [Corynebacterium falsenii]|uniref:fructosamine kinase family protein n=1 Tax=Corynebacterium falsenii TaxID=108486 RepID=UPI001CCE4274|nr:fructosamine kinase family protein [Corynebacterium falsenii]UBI06401.1 fructosamine kinase family protein [Corynebacterium falsenii]
MSHRSSHNSSNHSAQDSYWKNNPGATGQWEVAGLRWLGQAMEAGGARVVRVLEVTGDGFAIESVQPSTPTREAAERFGRALAATHAYGANSFGASPLDDLSNLGGLDDLSGRGGHGFQGPNDQLLDLPLRPFDSWGEFFATVCLEPLVDRVRPRMSSGDNAKIDALLERLAAGDFDDGTAPARIHGDLWSGNVLWGSISAEGASENSSGSPDRHADVEGILIDPVAHGGHPETDLAALDMFGAPHLGAILGAYEDTGQLQPGWRNRVPLHQQYILWLHAALFGGGYLDQTLAAVDRALRL